MGAGGELEASGIFKPPHYDAIHQAEAAGGIEGSPEAAKRATVRGEASRKRIGGSEGIGIPRNVPGLLEGRRVGWLYLQGAA
mmetsp:Transcript_16977/g.32214  ORF Transcript_16977/g.32214 Transcript_16977/m.32214 type:complete len:82 (+) Transcript_16977:90-335(+)